MESIRKLCSLFCFASIILLGARSEEGVEVYMLAFMNISTDRPNLLSYEQLVINAFEPNTDIRVITFDAVVDERTTLPVLGDGTGSIGIDFRTTADLVSGASERVTTHGVFVAASNKISLQAIKSVQQSTDGYQGIPLTDTSTEFYLMSYEEIEDLGHSTYAIAALEDYTCVEISRVDGPTKTRMAFITLNAYQVYNGLSQQNDYTGWYVEATKPVAAYAGHECAENPVGVLFCDHMQAQMPPVFEWGTEHIVPPILGRLKEAGYVLRVVVATDGTEVNIDCSLAGINITMTADRGERFVEKNVTDASTPTIVRCSLPCLVMQYNRGYRALGYNVDETKTDPFMTLIPSTKNYEFSLRFGTATYIALNKTFEFTSYLSVISPSADVNTVLYDLASITESWTDLGNGYSITSFGIIPGQHTVQTESGNVPIMGFVYGHGVQHITGYGYPAGFNVTGNKVRSTRLQVLSGVGPGSVNTTETDSSLIGTCEDPFDPSIVRTKDSLQLLFLTFDLKTPRFEPCATKVLSAMKGVLDDIKNDTNWLICLDLLCVPAESTWVYDISIVEPDSVNPLSEITFAITLWSSNAETIKNAVACKRHLTDYFSNFGDFSQRWRTPLPVGEKCDPSEMEFEVPPRVEYPKNWRCAV